MLENAPQQCNFDTSHLSCMYPYLCAVISGGYDCVRLCALTFAKVEVMATGVRCLLYRFLDLLSGMNGESTFLLFCNYGHGSVLIDIKVEARGCRALLFGVHLVFWRRGIHLM